MIWDIQKFNREIAGLKRLNKEGALHPLRKEQIKASLMSALAEQESPSRAILARAERTGRLMKYLAPLLIGLSLVGGTAVASNQSIPGDVLYPIKLITEQVEVKIAITAEAKAKVEAKHAEKRLDELVKLETKAQLSEAARVNLDLKDKQNDSRPNQNNILTASSSITSQVTSTTTATSTPDLSKSQKKSKEEKDKEGRVEVKARLDAQNQVKKAIQALGEARSKLEAKGKTKAAAEIGKNIERLEARAEKSGIGPEKNIEKDQKDQDEAPERKPEQTKIKSPEVNIKGTTTTTSKIRTRKQSGSKTEANTNTGGSLNTEIKPEQKIPNILPFKNPVSR